MPSLLNSLPKMGGIRPDPNGDYVGVLVMDKASGHLHLEYTYTTKEHAEQHLDALRRHVSLRPWRGGTVHVEVTHIPDRQWDWAYMTLVDSRRFWRELDGEMRFMGRLP